eukprot:CAMPEP_0201545978 /NCGR_PEP_ID=MMETSP0173_2-20130828/2377_1 /ASSEMBLY_ACC=CAM_ASM_000268 /TAXON_ID=218659 /ORGANISM="Vexillifera sp., Strain DIVA3 564/2" /LENGTH=164 /DNA_ID=CAMNT_0047954539 /DNA_START=610 /DNA_END=1100 /DNA_ORIENTATION=-
MKASVKPIFKRKSGRLLRPSKAAIEITDEAKTQIRRLMDASEGNAQQQAMRKALHLGIRTRGCNGLAYTLEWKNWDEKPGNFDEVVQTDEDIKVVIDSKALMHIIGSTMDFQKNAITEEFVFLNPNATGVCGCGESFSTGSPDLPTSLPSKLDSSSSTSTSSSS